MSYSFRQIADRMDPELPATSLRRLFAQHRPTFVAGEPRPPRSLRELCERHEAAQSVSLIWQNAYLLTAGEIEVGCEYDLPFTSPLFIKAFGHTVSETPAVERRATALGYRLAQDGYDVACLAEVFENRIRDRVLDAWREEAPLTWSGQGPAAQGRPPDLRLPVPCPALPGPFGPIPGAAAVRVALGNSGLLSLVRRHEVIDVEVTVFDNRGSPADDIDAYSAKGVLKASLVVDSGILSVFSTHAYAGESFKSLSEGHRDAIKRDEFEQLSSLVQREQEHHPERVCVVCGDLNRDGSDPDEPRYVELAEIMAGANLRDLWADRAPAADGSMRPGGTLVEPEQVDETREICAVGSDGSHCDERAPSASAERLDYLFVQEPSPAHSCDVDLRRPRRVYTELDPAAGGLEYVSDHLGVDTVMYVRAR